MSRFAGCLAVVLGLWGCATVGVRRVGPAPTGDDAQAPVILVLVEGLRADVFNKYMEGMRDESFEPTWRSGLALLARERFQLSSARRAEAPVPAVSFASLATIVSGLQPGRSGVPGDAYHRRTESGALEHFDFSMAGHASRVFFGRDLTPLANAADGLANQQLDGPTIFERLGPTRRGLAIDLPLAAGSDWRVPAEPRLGTDALLPHAVGASAVPLLDRATRDAAVDAILAEPLPDLLAIYFRRVLARSCQQSDEQCAGRLGALVEVQTEALKEVDEQLWRILTKLAAAHPGKFGRATVILTSTGGMVDRTVHQRVDARQVMAPERVFAQLDEGASEACAGVLGAAFASGELALAPNAGAALLTLAPRPPGERLAAQQLNDCLAAAIERAVRLGAWAAGGSWRTAEAPGVVINPGFEQTLPFHRRRRARRKLQALIADHPHAPDGVLIGQPGWIFVDEARPTLLPAAGRGGLGDDVMRIPFLVASRSLSPNAAAALRGAPIELADLAPTLLALLRAPESTWADLPRAPLLRWREDAEDVLDLEPADRQIAPAPGPPAHAHWRWSPAADTVTFGISEPSSVWPPTSLVLRFGDQRFVYDTQAERFPDGSPCVYARDDETRSWMCTLPRLTTPGVALAGGRRTPAGDEADGEAERSADFLFTSVWGDAHPRFTRAHLECASPDRVRVRVDAADEAGLRDLSILAVDTYGGGRRALPGEGYTTLALTPAQAPACADPTAVECVANPAPKLIGDVLEVPFPADRMAHTVRTSRLFSAHQRDEARLVADFAKAGGAGAPPQFAYLAARVCNLAGTCVQRALVGDGDYERALAAGCP